MEKHLESSLQCQTLHATVRGRVQNVGFRAFVQGAAQRLDLRGYTRNASDGSVEVVASGERVALDQLLSRLHLGPIAARVETVDYKWFESEVGLGPRFEVRG